jgi:hypothetical protein
MGDYGYDGYYANDGEQQNNGGEDYGYDADGQQQQYYQYDADNASSQAQDYKICKVYDAEDTFTSLVQAFLAAIALASLYLKRHREVPRRTFETWFLDVSKQGLGAVYAHILNMIVAAVIVGHARGDFILEDECAWYATMYVMDTVVGLILSIYFLKLIDQLADKHGWNTLMHSGVYVGPERYKTWSHQLMAWLSILSVVKVMLTFLMWLFSPVLAKWAAVLFQPFEDNTRIELLFVMIVFPGFLNVIWFWITDHFLKAEGHHAGAHEPIADSTADAKSDSLLVTGVDSSSGSAAGYTQVV